MMKPFALPAVLMLCLSISAMPALAADYLRDVKPLLEHKCYACHGAFKQQAGLRVDTAVALKRGGDSGSPIQSGQPDESLLMEVLTGAAGFRMPPENEGSPLTERELNFIRDWIADGAPSPDDELPQADPRSWWSYRPIVRPDIPKVNEEYEWCRGPIDCFVTAQRQQKKLPQAEEASKAVWLRRVYVDLIGLPPTRDELHDFLADGSPTAHEAVVDDLLSRPQYGERWGRHWMDIWRYSDWYGSRGINEIRYSQRHIWRWRDWIVASLNNDKGYDQMIREMLAADEIAGDDPAVLPATGYLGRSWYKFDRDVWMFETVERTGEAFLGLTLRCCRCHDHKFDPITQEEYYRFRAFFEPHHVRTDPISALTAMQKDATLGQVLTDGIALVYDKQPDAPTYRFERGDSRYPDKSKPLQPGVPAALAGDELEIAAVDLPPGAWYPILRPGVRETLIEKAQQEVTASEQKLSEANGEDAVREAKAQVELARAEKISIECRLAATVATYFEEGLEQARQHLALEASAAERHAAVLQAEIELAKSEAGSATETAAKEKLIAARKAAEQQSETFTPPSEQFPKTSTGRRSALAAWIASASNPRTARVAVNHLWGRHFGQPLAATPENFGLNGRQPTHPELLDWLAAELIANGWNMKPLHRQIVLSSTYRMSSRAAGIEDALADDPENKFLWRMNSRRMEAEVVRDSTLYLANQLNMQLGGPEIPETDGETVLRRSLYFRNTPNEKMSMLEIFDVADPNSCYRRKESVVPHQSLAMMNSGLTLDHARIIADQLTATGSDFISAAFETILARSPTDEEVARCQQFLAEQIARFNEPASELFPGGGSAKRSPSSDPATRARENLVHVLLLHNDFVTIR